jgi:hypothetical protein
VCGICECARTVSFGTPSSASEEERSAEAMEFMMIIGNENDQVS